MKKDIRSLEEIPFEKELIATGKVNRIVWFCRVPEGLLRTAEHTFVMRTA